MEYILNDEAFDIENLKDPNYTEFSRQERNEEKKKEQKGELTESQLRTIYWEEWLDRIVVKAAEAGNMEHLACAFEAEKKYLKKLEETYGKSPSKNPAIPLNKTLEAVLSFDTPYTENTALVIRWLLTEGGLVGNTTKPSPCGRYFITEYLKDPNPEKIEEIFDAYMDREFRMGFENASHQFRKYFNAVKTGTDADQYDDAIPADGKFPANFIGFEMSLLRVYGNNHVKVAPLGAIPKEFFSILGGTEFPKGMLQLGFNKYAKKYLVPEFEKMAQDGLFHELSDTGVVLFTQKGANEPLFTYIADTNANERFEKLLTHLETSDHWSENANMVPVAFCFLTKGIFRKPDQERACRLVEKHLYNCDSYEATELLLFWMASLNSPETDYLMAKWRITNRNFGSAASKIQALQHAGIEVGELQQQLATEKEKERLFEQTTTEQDGYILKFDMEAARKLWMNSSFEQVFTENDLYLETENVIARARTNGNIYIRFINENEEAYSDVLDFINRLLEKGYAYLSGGKGHIEGYAIYVRFQAQPIFVEEILHVKNTMISFPKTTCHAFFARAVQYPSLRKKVADYIERSVRKYAWYQDLQDEDNAMPGTFAVAALMLCDKQYLPLVCYFAGHVDDEHMYTQWNFPQALVNHYGNDPDLAPALYDLAANIGCDGPSRISADLLYNAGFLEKILEYSRVSPGDMSSFDSFSTAITYLYGENGKSNLKKLRAAHAKTTNEREKSIYTRFHDICLDMLKISGADEFMRMQPLAHPIKVKPGGLYSQDAIISLEEADRRGYKYSKDNWDFNVLFFSPALVTDPVTVRYIRQQWKNIGFENNKSWGRRRCNARLVCGKMCLRFGNWVVHSKDLEYDCGIILSGTQAKPVILYGEVDALALGIAAVYRWPQSPEEMEKLRRTYLIRESKLRNESEQWQKEDDCFSNSVAAYFSHWFLHTAKIALHKISDNATQSYLASRIMLAHLAEIDSDARTAKELYSELINLQPGEKEYWSKKAAAIR